MTILEERIYEALFLYRRSEKWFELNTVTLERLNTIFKAMNIESTIDEQKEASKALRYFTDEIMERALALAAWREQRNG